MQNQRKQNINDTQTLIDRSQYRKAGGRVGTIISYDPFDNTATVLADSEQSNDADEVLTKVPCPVNLGIQSVAPEPGRPCFVVFKDGNITQPLIVAFWNHRYDQYDYGKQTKAHVSIPSYLLQ